MKREIKKSVIVQQKPLQIRQRSRQRSRDKHKEQRNKQVQVQEINLQKRRQLLKRMRERQQEQDEYAQQMLVDNTPKVESYIKNTQKKPQTNINQFSTQIKKQTILQPQEQSQDDQDEPQQRQIILHKPVFVGKQQRQTLRNQQLMQEKLLQQHSKKIKIGRLNTKLLMNQTLKAEGQQEQQEEDSDYDNIEMPDDDDTKDEALEYQYWKIRQLKRIRRDKEQRNKFALQQADIERRRKMTDQQRLAENKKLGSDITDNTQTTKYVYMQKYYHRGAFFQDSDESVMKRNYNLPTAMELQDKTALPKILQKRRNDFGKKGQSKHTHLTDVDTTNFDPKTKANQSVMIALQKKMAGYKDSFLQNKR